MSTKLRSEWNSVKPILWVFVGELSGKESLSPSVGTSLGNPAVFEPQKLRDCEENGNRGQASVISLSLGCPKTF